MVEVFKPGYKPDGTLGFIRVVIEDTPEVKVAPKEPAQWVFKILDGSTAYARVPSVEVPELIKELKLDDAGAQMLWTQRSIKGEKTDLTVRRSLFSRIENSKKAGFEQAA